MTEPQPPVSWEPTPPPASHGSRRRTFVWVAAIIAVAVLVVLVLAVVRGAANRDTLASALAGEVWERLPEQTQDDLSRRAEAALGDEDLTQQEAQGVVQERVRLGMRRLDDPTLVRRLALQTLALRRTDEATCAGFARASFAGTVPPDDISAGLIAALDDASLAEWMTIAMTALEAETRDSPEARSVPDAESEALFRRLFAGLDGDRIARIQTAAAAGATPTVACDGARVLYAALDGLPADDRALAALVDILP